MSQPRESLHRVDHLVLLVGGNPLPNVVAAHLLASPGATISLIYTAETGPIAGRLTSYLREQLQCSVQTIEVDDASPSQISRHLRKRLDEFPDKRLGLHYTGGTKAMAVHAYRTVEQWARDHPVAPWPVFSYLNARRLEIVFDPAELAGGSGLPSIPLGIHVQLQLEELLRIHGWRLETVPRTEPLLPQTVAALLGVQADQGASRIWKSWLDGEFLPKVTKRPREWLSQGRLRETSLTLPASALQRFNDAIKSELRLDGNSLPIALGAQVCGYRALEDFCKWLEGTWLESAVLGVLKQLQGKWQLHDVSMNLRLVAATRASATHFEFDVVAIRGYQLFAFSCVGETDTNGDRRRLKQKLFEAITRARQLGGDEAGIALVCWADDPLGLQLEAQDAFNESVQGDESRSRIRVFGRAALADLKGHIERWIEVQSGG